MKPASAQTTATLSSGSASNNSLPETKQLPAAAQISQGLDAIASQIKAVLPAHISVDRFKRVVMLAIYADPSLLEANRQSLWNACVECASDGLVPNKRESALVVFNTKVKENGKEVWIKKVTYMPMVFGILKKLRQSGELSSITARAVYENELKDGRFKFCIDGGEERLTHEPILLGDRGKPVLYYSTARLKDGTTQSEVMTIADIDKVRQKSKNKDGNIWSEWPEEMSKKTVIRRLSKMLPLSSEDLRRVVESDAEDDPAEFQSMKQEAIASAQSIDIAASQLGGEPEPIEQENSFAFIDLDGVEHSCSEGEFVERLQSALYATKDGIAVGELRANNGPSIAMLPSDIREKIDAAFMKKMGQ